MTQNKQILSHMARFGAITPLVAMREYGVMRLAARIHDLQGDGLDINSVMRSRRTALTGRMVRFAEYSLEVGS